MNTNLSGEYLNFNNLIERLSITKSDSYDIVSILFAYIIFIFYVISDYSFYGKYPWKFSLEHQLSVILVSIVIAFQIWGRHYLLENIKEIFKNVSVGIIKKDSWIIVLYGICFLLRDFYYIYINYNSGFSLFLSLVEAAWEIVFYSLLISILCIFFNTAKEIDTIVMNYSERKLEDFEISNLKQIKQLIWKATIYYFSLVTIIIIMSNFLFLTFSRTTQNITMRGYTQVHFIAILFLIGMLFYIKGMNKIQKIFKRILENETNNITKLNELEYQKLEEVIFKGTDMNRYKYINEVSIALQNFDILRGRILQLQAQEGRYSLRNIIELIGILSASLISFYTLLNIIYPFNINK